jgi:hypothetical protein
MMVPWDRQGHALQPLMRLHFVHASIVPLLEEALATPTFWCHKYI